MNKAQSLLEHLLAAPIGLKAENIRASITNLKVISAAGEDNKSFEVNYIADLLFLDYAGNSDALLFTMLQWLDIEMPYRNPEEPAITGDTDFLDKHKADVNLRIKINETVIPQFHSATQDKPEGWLLHHPSNPKYDKWLDWSI